MLMSTRKLFLSFHFKRSDGKIFPITEYYISLEHVDARF